MTFVCAYNEEQHKVEFGIRYKSLDMTLAWCLPIRTEIHSEQEYLKFCTKPDRRLKMLRKLFHIPELFRLDSCDPARYSIPDEIWHALEERFGFKLTEKLYPRHAFIKAEFYTLDGVWVSGVVCTTLTWDQWHVVRKFNE